jgi:hypothetical protein
MTDGTLPSDYDASDGMGDNGIEQCPHCGQSYSPNGGHTGPVYDDRGREYETHLDTDPGDAPFFCPDCWPELEANRKASENKQLEDFA